MTCDNPSRTCGLLAVYDPAFQAADGSYWTWHAPELTDRLLATTYYELLVPNIPPDPNGLAVDHLWAGMGDVSDDWRCYFRFVNGGRDQRGRPGRFVVLCGFVARSDCQFCDPLVLLQGEEFKRLAQRARTECPLAAGPLQLMLEPPLTAVDPVLLAELLSAGRFRHTGPGAVQRAAQLIPGLPLDRRWQATLRDVSVEQRAEIWPQDWRADQPPETDQLLAGDHRVSRSQDEPEAPPASPANSRLPQRVLVRVIAPAAVAVLAAYGLQRLRLSIPQICLAVGSLLVLIWLLRYARSVRSLPRS